MKTLSADEAAIKAHFTKKVVQYVGSTSDCGCDFPYVIIHNWRSPGFEPAMLPEKSTSEQSNAEELVKLLRESGEKAIEVYGVWYGDFTEAPAARQTISLSSILDPHFHFKEKGFYTVQMD